MILGLVSGTVAVAHKDPTLRGITLLVVQELDLALMPTGVGIIVADCVGAGRGDLVIIARGTAALHTEITAGRPIDATAIAIVENVNIE